MKTIVHTLIAAVILFMNTESYSSVRNRNDYRNINTSSMVPVSPRNWEASDAEIPSGLQFIRAKSALVPVSEFVWGDPDAAAPSELLKSRVPVPASNWTEAEAPGELKYIKAKYALVPVPAKVWLEAEISAEERNELALLN